MQATKYRCLIIDDEPAAHYVLASHIEKSTNLLLSGQCYNALDALNYLRKNSIDLLFLDIDMPEMTGLELLSSLATPPKTILTTAHSKFALESYEYGVIDYLLKPISLPRFIKSIERFLSLYQTEINEPQSITLKVDGHTIELDQECIEYTQSYGNYVKVFTSKKIYLAQMTTQELSSNLSGSKFIRIHKSYIVNLEKVTGHLDNEILIHKIKLPIGITYKRELLERLGRMNIIS